MRLNDVTVEQFLHESLQTLAPLFEKLPPTATTKQMHQLLWAQKPVKNRPKTAGNRVSGCAGKYIRSGRMMQQRIQAHHRAVTAAVRANTRAHTNGTPQSQTVSLSLSQPTPVKTRPRDQPLSNDLEIARSIKRQSVFC